MYDRDGLFLLVNEGASKLWRWRYRFDDKEKLMAWCEYPLVNLGQARELHFAGRWLLALIRWLNARRKPTPNRGKPKHDSMKVRIALRTSPANGGNGGLLASLPVTPIPSGGVWKRTFSRRLATSSFTG
jgi:hypothetical protein